MARGEADIEIERFEQVLERSGTSSESFDRIAFAERAIALVRPPHTTVAICEGSTKLTVSSGRQWGREPDARWAIVAVPFNASRQAIATAVLELHTGPSRAWALDVLMRELGQTRSPHRMFGT